MNNLKDFFKACSEWIQKNARILIGLVIFVAGLVLIARSLIFIVNLALFIAGIMLVYYSLRLLNLIEITNKIDAQYEKIKDRFFR